MHAWLRIPLSYSARRRNLPQEAGSVQGHSSVKILGMESRTAAAPRLDPRPFTLPGRLLLVLLLVVQWIVSRANLEAAVVATSRLTLIVYDDKPMPEEEWTALSSALEKEFDHLALETHLVPGGVEIVRNETLSPGARLDSVIPIYLHGSCRLLGQPDRHEISGALGWVLRDHGQIRPFIHVDCARIAEMLGQPAQWMDHGKRNAAMAQAISRVVVHEWVHIATQSPAHTRDGIEKGSFGLQDLAPDYARMIPHSSGK